jgi:Ca2+/Na+ antiporter
LSAIVGSTLFNTLGVCACASIFTKQPVQIDWWPLTRDSILFVLNVIILVIISWDGIIMWYETCILVALYVGYWTLMFQNRRIMGFVKHIVENKLMWCQRIKNFDIENQMPKNVGVPSTPQSHHEGRITHDAAKIAVFKEHAENMKSNAERDDIEEFKLWQIPRNVSKPKLLWYFYTWPIRFLLCYTIPDPNISSAIIPLSFMMCVVWIGSLSYMIFWMVVIVGDTFLIPEPVMGLTFLAFGGCMPEAISAVIVARRGSGEMGVSNALGANCLAILFSLGLPWFITTMLHGAGSTNAHIHIYSYGMEYTIMVLILAVATLYSVLAFNGYKLSKIVGVYLFIAYIIFVTFAILMEFNVFLVGAPADC